jgi:hypothetical protein
MSASAPHRLDPALAEAAAVCPQCKYSLEGLARSSCCPECGTPYDGRQVLLHGIMRAAGTPLWRRFAWGLLIALWTLYANLWAILLFEIGWVGVVAILLFLGTLSLGMFLSGKGEQHGIQMISFTIAGAGFFPSAARQSQNEAVRFVPWTSGERVEFRRISPFWRRMRVYRGDTAILDIGYRCPDDIAPEIQEALSQIIRREPLSPTTSSTFASASPGALPPQGHSFAGSA